MFYVIIVSFIIFSCNVEVKNKDIVYLSPDCGCCHDWISHMESNDFTLKKNMDSNMYDVKINAGLPIDLASCHTAIINGYFVEGHVPASDVKRLIKDQEIKYISKKKTNYSDILKTINSITNKQFKEELKKIVLEYNN